MKVKAQRYSERYMKCASCAAHASVRLWVQKPDGSLGSKGHTLTCDRHAKLWVGRLRTKYQTVN